MIGSAVPSTDWWLIRWGAAALAFVGLAGAVKLMSIIVRDLWRAIERMNAVADVILGDKTKGQPPLDDRLKLLELASHTHQDPPRTDGIRPRRPTGRR